MAIFKRIKNIMMAETHGLLDKVEDPIEMLNQYVREMEQEINKGQQALSNQIFLEKKQETLIIETEELISKRNRQAKLAVERGEEQIAKLAVQEKLIQEKQLHVYQEQYEMIKSQTTTLWEQLNQLKQKYQELQQKRLLLVSRANVAHSMKQMHNTFISFSTENVARGVARAEERVVMKEAEVQAGHQLSKSSNAFNPRYMDVAMQDEVEKEIQKLKGLNTETA
ncbi:PspA/IM30 family protein [Priestia abyssalis]|uniref:PspA/IM30 family protein n=1 Tax=Priestia abyssalis TaxID=1221450 RepID=UPI0009955556|nr:PspA/IM30 family protein [Priestia abyssalis]